MALLFLRIALVIILASAAFIVVMRLLYPLPEDAARPYSRSIPMSPNSTLGAAVSRSADPASGSSGVLPLVDGRDALAARVLLARAAEVSIDVQYYIWQRDVTGWILLDELRQAAERGVRVRLLLDDNGIPGLDRELAAFDALPNVEVRLFNPFTLRSPKLASYLFDFPRLNRRMHNKSFTVDGAVTVIGGRNIGDIYFAFGDGTKYFDLDVIAAGQAATDVATSFDLYWNSASVYPASVILPPSAAGLQGLVEAGRAARGSVAGSAYLDTIRSSRMVLDLLAGGADLEWTTVQLVADDPRKGLGEIDESDLLIGRLPGLLDEPERSLDLVSAYFIPGKRGTDLLTELARNGVATRVLTNSLDSTDVTPVHGAYMKYRPALLDAGVTLRELRSRPSAPAGSLAENMLAGSAASLHAKTFAIDDKRIFIGSFNFDPRSARLNSEMGFLIESPMIATMLRTALDADTNSYLVRQSESGELEWVQTGSDGIISRYDAEPNTSMMKRATATLLSWLPVEWML